MYSKEQVKAFILGSLLTIFAMTEYYVFCINSQLIQDKNTQQQIVGFLQAKPQPIQVK